MKILVIDDDRMNCELIQSVFTRHGYQVLSATSGIEGLTLFRQQAPRVTILDLRMPEMDGLTVLKEIRAYDPHALVIILGGGATEERGSACNSSCTTRRYRRYDAVAASGRLSASYDSISKT